MNVECAVPAKAQLGECPLWSESEAVLYWVDISGRLIHRYDPATGTDVTRATPGRPGSIALTETRGLLLVASEHEVGWFEWEKGAYTPWVQLEPPGTRNRLNDGRCDRHGRFWVGSMWETAAADKFTGMLHRIEPSGAAETVRTGIGVTNGLAFSSDGRTMYFADTLHDTIWKYDYDPDTGAATNERVFSDFAGLPGRPDGACIDSEGGYWVACVHGGAVARLAPDGSVDRIIDVPVARPTMPAFGGPALDVLYVTSIGDGSSRLTGEPHSHDGDLLAIDVGITGVVETPFGGSP